MSLLEYVKILFGKKKQGFENPIEVSKNRFFDVGLLPALAMLLVVLSTFGMSVFFKKSEKLEKISEKNSIAATSSLAGQIDISKTLISHSNDTARIGDTVTFRVAYSNIGTNNITSIPFTDVYPSGNMQFLNVYGNASMITTQPSKDNWISEKNSDSERNYGIDDEIKIKVKVNDDRRGLMHFDLSSYAGYNVTDANFYTFIESGFGDGNTIEVYELTQSWDEGTGDSGPGGTDEESNWESATPSSNWTSEGGDYNPALLGSIATTTQDWYSTTLPTNIIQNWIDNSAQNYGLILISSGVTDDEIKLESLEGDASKISYLELTLQQNITVDYQNGDTLILNNLGALAAGASDSILITFLATDSCTLCTTDAQVNDAEDVGSALSSDSDIASLTILPCNDIEIVLAVTNTPCPNDTIGGAINVTITGSTMTYGYHWNDIEPEGHWIFESTTDDFSGNENDAEVFTGTESYSPDAVEGSESFEFDGATKIQYSVDDAFMSQDITERSISMWIKPDNLVDNMALYEEGNGTAGIGLRLKSGNLEGAVLEGGVGLNLLSTPFPTDGNWHHVGLTYDGDSLTLFLDGTPSAGVATGLGTITFDAATYGGIGGFHTWHPFILADYSPFAIGTMIFFGSVPAEDFYTGLMDNVANFEMSLNADQIGDLAANSPNRTNLLLGNYTITVTDEGGCSVTETATIAVPPAMEIDTILQMPTCFEANDGSIEANAKGGNGTYTYAWSNGTNSNIINSLSSGTYTLTVTDVLGCIDSFEIVLGEPTELVISIDSISNYNGYSISCIGGNDGKIYTTPSGGTAPYSFAWSVGSGTSEDTLGLLAGTYEVTVTDAFGCTAIADTTLTEPTIIDITLTPTDQSCSYTTNGKITSSVSGGEGNYTYSWSTGSAIDSIENLSVGTYTLTVTDGNGCQVTAEGIIDSPAELVISIDSISNYNGYSISCIGGNDGKIYTTPSGGTAPYTFAWSIGSGTSEDTLGLLVGTYEVTVTDALGCTAIADTILTEPTIIDITLIPTDQSCSYTNDGKISSSVSGGEGNYTYSWSTASTIDSIENLSVGTYTLTVTDGNGCQVTAEGIIDSPAELVISIDSISNYNGYSISCIGGNDGKIYTTPSGGTAPYTFAWSVGSGTSEDTLGLLEGTYEVTVTDAQGCTAIADTILTEPTIIDITLTPTDQSCSYTNDGKISSSVSGGEGNYTYSWSTVSTIDSIENLSVGTYTLTVTDGNGCQVTAEGIIDSPAELVISIDSISNYNGYSISCIGGNDGKIYTTPSGGTAPYTFAWSVGSGTSEDTLGLLVGTYEVTVTDAFGCTAIADTTLTEPTIIDITLTLTDQSCSYTNDGKITSSVSGGEGNYTYSWSTVSTIDSIENLSVGTYTLTVTDGNGCQVTAEGMIDSPAELVISIDSISNYNGFGITCNGNNDGKLYTTPSGGTAPYSFAWSVGSGTSEDTLGLLAGNYEVTVTDFNGCTAVRDTTLLEPSTLGGGVDFVDFYGNGTNLSCVGAADGKAVAFSYSGVITNPTGVAPYTYEWSNGQTEDTLRNVSAGKYYVTTTDANTCTYVDSITFVNPPARTVSLAITQDISCVGDNDGEITATPTGGSGGDTFTWSTGATGNVVTGLVAGTYTVTVADDNNCQAIDSIIINDPDTIKIAGTLTDPGCVNGTGSITINMTGGTGAFTQAWSSGQTTDVITNLNAGTYTVTVSDILGCEMVDSFTLSDANVLAADISATDYSGFEISCYGASDGNIDVEITGGTGPYSYSWNSGQSSEDLTNVVFGNYNVTITDIGGGCTISRNISLDQPAQLGVDTAYITTTSFSGFGVSCYGESDGQIWVSAFGGDGTHNYAWSTGTTGVSGITSLAPGTYTVTVTDGRTCTASASYTLLEPPLLTLDTAFLSTANFNGFGVSCNGAADGEIWVTAAGGDGTHNYAWSNGTTGVSGITGLVADTYTVTLTDGNSCDTTMTFTITEPNALSINNTITDVLCNGESNGRIDLEPSGGTGIFTYQWSTIASDSFITGLAAGDYTTTVTDENGCSLVETYTVDEPDALSSTAAISDVKCFDGNDGAIVQTVSGGRTPYSYAWSNGGTAKDISTLTDGTYTVTITDFNDCTFTNTFTVDEPIDLTLAESHEDASCYESSDGSIVVTPSGGTPIYTYLWSNGGTDSTLTSIVADTYTLTVTDNNNCQATISVSVSQPTAITSNVTVDSVVCYGENNGSISLAPSGGTAGYTYNWSNSVTTPTNSGLVAGTYTVTITDSETCTLVESYTVYEPADLTATLDPSNVLCHGGNSGSITANPIGGTTPYIYSWNTGANTPSVSNLFIGTYTVTITDKNNCSTSVSTTISQPDTIDVTHVATEPLCNGDFNGKIKITATGGVSPYTYLWDTGATIDSIINISAGNYTVTVTDLQSCNFVYNITLTEPNVLAIASSTTDNLCFGDSIGTIDLTVTDGTPNYVFDWSDMDNEAMWTFENTTDDVSGNNHDAVNISGTEQYSNDAVGGQSSFDFDDNSKIRYSVNSGGFLENAFNTMTISMWVKPNNLTTTQTLFERGTASRGLALRLDDADVQGVVTLGGSAELTAKVAFPNDGNWHHLALVYDNGDLNLYVDGVLGSAINTSFSTITSSSGNGGIGGTQGSDAFGNTGNLYYDGKMDNVFFHNNALTETQIEDLADNDGDRTGLKQGTYTIEITDGNGCQETTDITINEPTILSLTTDQTNVACNGGSDGVARVIASGATAPYTYDWGGGNTLDSLTGLSIGDYMVTVTDNVGCVDSISITILEPTVLTANAIGTDVDCNGSSDGSIALTVNGGTPNYSFSWSGGAGISQNPTGLSAATYTVTVTDDNGCTTTASASIGEPAAISLASSVTDISCFGETDGTIEITPSGGTAGYTYAWSNGGSGDTKTNLAVGTYTVTVSDVNGCTSSATNSIIAPDDINIVGSVTDVSCNGGDDGGVIDLTVTGGTLGYSYLWSDMDVEAYYGFENTTDDETGNNHDAQAIEGSGSIGYALDTIERDYAFDFDGDTKIDYEENSTFLNGTISNFSLSMWVKPDNFSGTQTLFEMGSVAAGFAIRLDGTNLTVGVNESFIVYFFSIPFPNDGQWHHITMTFDNGDLTAYFDAVDLGTYTTGVGTVSIPNSQDGGLGGTFGTDAFGGAGDNFYEGLMDGVGYFNNTLTDQQVLEVMQNDGTREFLTAATYTVTVLDANGCAATQTLSVTEPPALTISNTKVDIGCNGAGDGTINITVGGGTPNYSYVWSNAATSEDLTGIGPGDYTVTVTDDNDCTITLTETITQPTALSVSTERAINYSGSDISCAGNSDGAVRVNISGGTAAFSILWSTGDTVALVDSLAAGTYTVTVTDAQSCTGTSSVTLSDPAGISLSVARTIDYNNQDLSCYQADNGELEAVVGGGSGTYFYSWSNGATTDTIVGLAADTYTVTVTDGFGCTVSASRVVSQPTVLDISIALDGTFGGSGVSCPDETDGNILSTVSGGTTGYTYLWNGGQTTDDLNNIGAGIYMLTVTDANGCTSADTLTITAPSDLNFTTKFADLTDCGADDGAILITASGSTGSYEYSIDGTTWQTANQFDDLAPGTYNVYVRNDVGTCLKGPKIIVIDIPEAPIINNTVLINPSTGVSTDGSIIISATSTNGEKLLYQLEGITAYQESPVFSNLTAGTYTINVKYYTQSCETSTTVELIAGGGVVGGSNSSDYCSGEINSGQLVETYYIPFPENQVLESLYSFNDDACGWNEKVRNPVLSYVSIGVVEEGTLIYYDHWEDGYETNLGFPIQPTTEVWGDGDTTNGYAPGYGATDLFNSSDNVILDESIDTTFATRIATVNYDGGDKISSRGNIAMTRLAWATGSRTLLAGALEVYPTSNWGTEYEIPVGENYSVNNVFQYTGFVVMAKEDNTTVQINADATGGYETIITLDEGESYLANGGVDRGGEILASADVQVHLITGDDCAGFESRWYTLKPTEQWSNAYYTPVSTTGDDTYIHIYNPNSGTITIDWETSAGTQTSFTVASGVTGNVPIPNGSGAKFSSSGGEDFYAISTTGTYSSSSFNDWGFALIPEDQLSPQITLVGYAPGIDPTVGCQSLSLISQAGWSVQSVDSEELVDETAPATNAFDGNNSTYWHTEYGGGSDPTHPHELQIDLGADYNIGGFRYQPRAGTSSSLTVASTDVSKYLAANNTITSTLTFPNSWTISDVNLINFDMTHTDIEDLEIWLQSPNGTDVRLFNEDCNDSDNNMFLDFDDEGSSSFPCPPTSGNAYQSLDDPLSDFDGENANGTWTLTVISQSSSDNGTLNGWSLEVTTSTAGNGGIEDYEFYVSEDGTNWETAVATGTFLNSASEQEITFPTTAGRYVRIVANSELNANPWTSIAELNVLECDVIENYSPIWLTAAFPTGSTSTGNINVCIDYNGDGGTYVDANGINYDSLYVFTHLESEKILDPDGDQTGTRIWVCDNSDAIIAGAWGQDPSTAPSSTPAIDLGTGLPNGIPFSTSKCVNLSKDYNLDGNFDECDEVLYTIIVQNTGVLPLSTGSLSLIDTLPNGLTYIENTTISRTNGVNDTIPDEISTATVFPLDETGINYNSVIQPGDSIIIFFQASIDDLSGSSGTIITNQAYISNYQTEFIPEVTFPVDNPENPLLTGVPADITIECDSIPTAPVLNEPNCELTSVDYPAAQTSGTTDMDGEALVNGAVTTTFTLLESGITEQFRIADNLYPRDALQNIPCGASTKAIDFQIQQAESNGEYSADSTSVFEMNFSQPVENLSFSINDLDESLFYVDAVEVRIFDGSNAEIDYECGFFQKNDNVAWVADKEFQAVDNTDGFSPVADTDADGDIRFTFYNISIKRVEITLKNNWNTSSSAGTTASTFAAYMSANPGASHGVGIGQICFCVPGTNDGTIFVANDCVGIDSTAYAEVRVDGSCDSEYTLTRSWTTTDHCGNDTTMTQTITVVDNAAPVLSGTPADITASPSTIPIPPMLTCTDGVNLALGKTSTQSSEQYSSPASFVNDGDLTNSNHTLETGDPQPWWQVDLGAVENISVMEIYNRASCCQNRTTNYYIFISNTPFASNDLNDLLDDPNVASYYQSTEAVFPTTINISRDGRYVRIQLTSTSLPMNIAEVMVYGSVANCITALDGCDSYPNIAFTEDTTFTSCNYTIERIWTATDDCGNIQRDTQEIFVEALLSATDSVLTDYNGRDISCFGGSDGAAHVVGVGGVRPYTYAWTGSASVDSFATGLSVGDYTVTITDNNLCTSVRTITLANPPVIDLSASATSGDSTYQISCFGDNDGTAFATATNGTGTLTYAWSTGAATQGISGLVAGDYTVTVTDINLCQTTATITLAQPDELSISTSISTEVSCTDGNDGSILATPVGGALPYSLAWNTGDTVPNLSGLSIGKYTITVTDGNGCSTVDSIILNNPTPIAINFTIDNPISCFGGNDGEVSAAATGGAGGFSYAWSTLATDSNIINLSFGKYYVTATDANLCTQVDSITINNPNALNGLISVTSNFNGENISCVGASDGRVKVIGSGGTAPYTYLWDDGSATTIDSLDGVVAGTYEVTITDFNLCTATTSIEIFDPAPLVADAGSNQNNCSNFDTEFGVTVIGGATNYTYLWSTGATTDSITVSAANDSMFYVTVTDANSCTSIDSVQLVIIACSEICDNGVDDDFDGLIDCDDPDCFAATLIFVSSDYNGSDVTCLDAADGEITARPNDGKEPYTFLWSDPLSQTDSIATGLEAGTYTVTITDDNNCSATASITVQNPDTLQLSVDSYSATVSCAGDTDGFVDVSVTGGTTLTGTDYTYAWSVGGITTQDIFPPLSAGTYTVTVTDINDCTTTTSVIIADPDTVNVGASVVAAYGSGSEALSCVNSTDGLVVANATGGDGSFDYEWSTGATNDSLINVGAGTYTVTVTDGSGCTLSAEATLTNPTPISMSVSATSITDCGIADGEITASASGGTGIFEYSMDNSTWQASNIFPNLTSGTYTVYVRNIEQTCFATTSVLVDRPDEPTIFSVAAINPQLISTSDGEILVEANGAASPLEYRLVSVTPWQTSSYFQGLTVGDYTVEVRNPGITCSTTQVARLVAGAGLFGDSGASYCSDDFDNEQISEVYYIPIPEDQALNSLSELYTVSCGSAALPASPIRSYVSISVVETDAIIYYDHWEDDFENDFGNITQATTEIWGDGDLTNGVAPGYPTDLLSAGDVIILDENVNTNTRLAVIDFDGGDKIASRGNLAITRLAWASGSETFLAGAVEIYPTVNWGNNFVMPIGEDNNVNELFEYTGATVMAAQDNTTINIDADADGTDEISTTINEGESYLINGGINVGATITSDNPVQVHLLTGNICEDYEGRWFTVTPRDQWSTGCYNPVGTQVDISDVNSITNDPTYVHLFNPNSNLIVVRWETKLGAQSNINIPAGTSVFVEVPDTTGSHFYTNNGREFYAIATIGSEGETLVHDWGFALVPENQLTPQITMVGFAPGQDPTYTGGSTNNTAPVWLTGDYPSGSGSSGSITVCVDFNGDGGALLDANNIAYDSSFTFTPIGQVKIADPDGDQTGMRIWVCDGSDAIIAGAWGQDPAASSGSGFLEEIDLGTGLPNGIPFTTNECVDLTYDYYNDGLFDVCDEVTYTISIHNTGALTFPAGTILITDTLASELTYLENSAIVYVNGIPTAWGDDATPPASSVFPFDEGGATYPNAILPGDSIEIIFTTEINAQPTGDGIINNEVIVFDGTKTTITEVDFYVENQSAPTLLNVPTDITVDCDSIPNAPAIDSSNCTLTEVPYPIAQPSGTTAMNGQNLTSGGVTTTFSVLRNTIIEDFNMTDGQYPRSAAQGMPCGASTKAISLTQEQEASNMVYSSGDSSIIRFEFSQPVEDLSFGLLDFDEGVYFVDGATVRIYDAANNEITYDCSQITLGRNITMEGSNHFHALDNSDGYTTIADTDSVGDVRFNFFDIAISRVDIVLKNDWNSGSTSSGTSATTFADYFAANPNADHGIAISEMCYCVPGTIASEGTIIPENDCRNEVTVAYTETTGAFTCANNYTITRTWTATDHCGQSTVYNQTITVQDTIGSTLVGVPADITVTPATVPAIPTVTATDNCGVIPIVTYSVDSIPDNCQYIINRIWTAQDECSNIVRDTQFITVNVLLNASASVTSNFNTQQISCFGENDGEASVEVSGDFYPYNFNWSNSDSDSILNDVIAGTYTVTVTNAIGCTTTASVSVGQPTAVVATARPDTSMCAGEPVLLSAAGGGGNGTYQYTWNNSLGTGQTQLVNPLVTTIYEVTVTDLNGCSALDQVTVTIVACSEICTDGIDNDGDGDTDCDDSDCTPLVNNAILNTCDNSNMTGSGTFFLHDANPTVSTESGVMISYHATLSDAQNGIYTLISPYTSANVTVYARVERISTGCYATAEITLTVGAKCAENCNNGKDDDGDGLIDCDDSDCPCCDAYAPSLNGLNKKDP